MNSLQKDLVVEYLRGVVDPELGVNIVDLGLVYGVEIENNNITVKMTLTSPACPLGEVITEQVSKTLSRLPWAASVKVQLVWSPCWNPRTMASEDARMELGIF